MNPPNHTPGPWHTQGCTIYSGKNRVAQTWDTCDDFPTPTMEADADLIASAPDLLRALELALSWLESAQADQPEDWQDNRLSDAVNSARAAISKAKGQE